MIRETHQWNGIIFAYTVQEYLSRGFNKNINTFHTPSDISTISSTISSYLIIAIEHGITFPQSLPCQHTKGYENLS